MVGNNSSESLLPGLEAFDEEFGREPTDILHNEQPGQRRFSRFIWAVLATVLIAALVWLWVRADWGVLNEVQAFLPISRSTVSDTSAEELDRLVREVATLKQEIADLTEARQNALDRIASLDAEETRTPAMYWYSDLSALKYEPPFPIRSTGPQTEGSQR
jgi:cell division protein FtsB